MAASQSDTGGLAANTCTDLVTVLGMPPSAPVGTQKKAWKPSLTIKHLLIGIQTLLDDPNNSDPAQEEPYRAFKSDRKEYDAKVKAQVLLLRG